MHRASPLMTSFRSYSSGGARSVVDTADDDRMMQEMSGNFMAGETRQKIESPQNYGFTSVVLPAKKDKDGKIEESAEAFIGFQGGNRSFPVAYVMDDRRHRPMGLKPGENAQYDDIGQMTLMRRNGLFLLTLDSEDESQSSQGGQSGGATPTQQAAASGGSSSQGKKVERMVSLRHVEKKKQERKKQQPQQQDQGSGGTPATTQMLTAEQQATQSQGGQQGQSQQDFKHEGEAVNTEVRCTKNRIEFRAGDKVVGYYDVAKKEWGWEADKITSKVEKRFETIGKTYLGLDETDENAPAAVTVDGPAKQTWAKV